MRSILDISALDRTLQHHRMTPGRVKFAGTHLYTGVERGIRKVKCLAQEHNAVTHDQGSNPDRLIVESCELTIWSLLLPLAQYIAYTLSGFRKTEVLPL